MSALHMLQIANLQQHKLQHDQSFKPYKIIIL
jgi:hypothetical protein